MQIEVENIEKETPVSKHRKNVERQLLSKLYSLRPEKYEMNDKGNGQLFADVYKDILRYNATAREWYWFDGKRWKQDTGGMIAERKAKELSDALFVYSCNIEDDAVRTEYIKHVARMGSRRTRKTMIDDSRDINFITNENLDKDLFLLNCQNGVLNLNTFEFVKHSPDFLMSKIAQVEYDPDASSSEWEKFINEALQGNKSKIEYLQKLYGYAMTGGTAEESCYLLYGSTTRNGKSTAIETFAHMLGNTDGYALNMKPETLAQKNNNDSRQASGDIARLDGCRFLNASEPPKRMIFDVALLKTLLGRDSITARHLHQSEFQFIPVFKLFINTNFLPVITDDTLFSSGRLNVITFDRHFKPDEQDKGLKDRLKEPKNLSGLLNWCIRGLKKYYAEGALPPKDVTDATAEYRSASDKVGNFFAERMEKSTQKCTVKEAYSAYSEWCKENGYGAENKSNFVSELKLKELYAATGTVKGKTCKNVITGYTVGQFLPAENSGKIPFN